MVDNLCKPNMANEAYIGGNINVLTVSCGATLIRGGATHWAYSYAMHSHQSGPSTFVAINITFYRFSLVFTLW